MAGDQIGLVGFPTPGAPAGTMRRIIATILDSFALWIGVAVLNFFGLPALVAWLPLAVVGAYFVLLTARRGQTFGKLLMGIEVVSAAGRPPSILRVVMRELVGKPAVVLLMLGLFVVALPFRRIQLTRRLARLAGSATQRGWHDRIAGTAVMRVSR
jgi:uncharacterized RDD family membrane protein YckC